MRPAIGPFALAGVYDVWKGAGGQAITSFAIVTPDASSSVAQYHNRMPVVLDGAQFDDWMRGSLEQAAGTMKPYPGTIDAWEVAAEVGNVRNNRPELMEPVGLDNV
jgi:putative SOS response-associated peptidase YedK